MTRSMPRGGSRLAVSAIFLIVGMLLPLLFLEALLRMFGPILPGRYSAGLYQEPHPIYGRYQIPNTSGWYRADEFASRVQFNDLGLRERDIPRSKSPGERRVLVLGDSFVMGAEVDVERTLTRRLEDQLGDAGFPATVINAGVAGFSTDQELLLLDRLGWSMEPDVVVLVFYLGNDVTENSAELTRLRKPHFVVNEDGSLEQIDPLPPPPGSDGLSSWLRRESRVASVFDTGLAPKIRTIPGIGRLFALPTESTGPEPVGAGPGGSDVYRDELSQSWQRAWQVTDRLLARMSEQARNRNVPFLLVGAPSKWEVYPDDWQTLLDGNRLPLSGWDLDGPGNRLAAIAGNSDIKYVSARPHLRAVASSPERQYFRHDVHWTPAGHEAVAEVVASTLLDQSGLQAWTRE